MVKGVLVGAPQAQAERPGFLAGGHQNMKRDWALQGGEWEPALSPLHTQARNIIQKTFPEGKHVPEWGGVYSITTAFQIDLPQDDFNAVRSQGEQFNRVDYLWHGTKFGSVSAIAHNNLEVRGAYCLMGAGIYLAPDFAKAWNYTGGRYTTRTVLLCAVRLGKVWRAYTCKKAKVGWRSQCDDKACECKKKPNATICRANGGDTAMTGSGAYTTAWGGRIRFGEYAVYDAQQVLPVYAICFDPA